MEECSLQSSRIISSLQKYKDSLSNDSSAFNYLKRLTDSSNLKTLPEKNCPICRSPLAEKNDESDFDASEFDECAKEEEDTIFCVHSCRHLFHKSCLWGSLKAGLEEFQFPLRCPGDGERQCLSLFSLIDLKKLVSSDNHESLKLDFLKGELRISTDFRLCPNCESFVAKSDGGSWIKFCNVCAKDLYFTCGVEHSSDLSCIEANEKLSLEFSLAFRAVKKKEKELVWKLCRNCGSPYDKKDGCNSLVCGLDAPDKRDREKYIKDGSGCGHTFNWDDARTFVPSAQSEFIFNFIQYDLEFQINDTPDKNKQSLKDLMSKEEFLAAFFEAREANYWPEVMAYFRDKAKNWSTTKTELEVDESLSLSVLSAWNMTWALVWSSAFKYSSLTHDLRNNLRDEHWNFARQEFWQESCGEYRGLSDQNADKIALKRMMQTHQKDLRRILQNIDLHECDDKDFVYRSYEYFGLLYIDHHFEDLMETAFESAANYLNRVEEISEKNYSWFTFFSSFFTK